MPSPHMSSRELALEGDLRQALENYFGAQVSGHWDDAIEVMARAIISGQLDLDLAARLDLSLRRSNGTEPDECAVCKCPCPGVAH